MKDMDITKASAVLVGGQWLHVENGSSPRIVAIDDGQRAITFVCQRECCPNPRAYFPLGHVQAVLVDRTWEEVEAEKP